jgi:chromosome segregation ATPase
MDDLKIHRELEAERARIKDELDAERARMTAQLETEQARHNHDEAQLIRSICALEAERARMTAQLEAEQARHNHDEAQLIRAIYELEAERAQIGSNYRSTLTSMTRAPLRLRSLGKRVETSIRHGVRRSMRFLRRSATLPWQAIPLIRRSSRSSVPAALRSTTTPPNPTG